MKAARLFKIKEDLQVVNVPEPVPGKGEVLINIMATGICTSDLHYRDGSSKIKALPITLGHEIAGLIQDVGDDATLFSVGERVGVYYLITCGKCHNCKMGRENYCQYAEMLGKTIDGGFAEYLVVPERNLFRLPRNVSLAQGALISDAIGTPFHALTRARIQMGETVMIVGIGGLGLHAVQLARVMGATTVIAVDINDEKLSTATIVGADFVVNAASESLLDNLSHITAGAGVDVVVDFTGNPTSLRQSLNALAFGGRLVSVGICPVDFVINPYHDLLLKERSIISSADQLHRDFEVIVRLIESGTINLDHSVSHKVPLSEINYGMQILEEKIGNPIRVVVSQE